MESNEKKTNMIEAGSDLADKVLVEPWITEASTAAAELHKYVFKVSQRSAKAQIKKAIESLYKVKVVSVNTVNVPRKKRNYGRTSGWKSGFRKAVVTLKEGDKIELFEGV